MNDEQQHSPVNQEPPAGPLSLDSVWQPLHYFNVYRLLLAGPFLALVVWGDAPRPLGETNITLFRAAAAFYFLFALSSAIAGRLRRPDFDTQVVVQIYVDIFFFVIFSRSEHSTSARSLGRILTFLTRYLPRCS